MVSVDVYRPAAREQLRVVAREVNLPIYTGTPEETLPADERFAGQNVVH
jgi:signal recognition particle subunit SRP54